MLDWSNLQVKEIQHKSTKNRVEDTVNAMVEIGISYFSKIAE